MAAATSYGALLALLRARGPMTRRQLLDATGVARATLVERLDTLGTLKLVRQGELHASTGGRPAVAVEFDDTSRVVLAADVGATHATFALTDLSGRRLVVRKERLDVHSGPEVVIDRVVTRGRELLADSPYSAHPLLGAGIGIPAPIGSDDATVNEAPMIPEWAGTRVADVISRALGVPVIAANDANAMAYGEYLARSAASGRSRGPLLVVKVSTGLGAGLVLDGKLHRGNSGAASELGHVRKPGSRRLCTCGERGCLGSVAAGWALLARLPRGRVRTLDDIVALTKQGDRQVLAAVRESAEAVGEVLAGAVTMIDPEAVLFGGILGRLPAYVEAVRGPLLKHIRRDAASRLEIGTTALGEESAVAGLAGLVINTILAPDAVDAMATRVTTNAEN